MPLTGLRVLDLSRLLPGPFCTQLFADMGADVVKVEDTGAGDHLRWMPPMAGEYSAAYHALNRGKRAIRLDLKDARGVEIFLRLCEHADVVLESFRPGVVDRLGVGWEVLHARNPRLVLCSISGYGQDGPFRERAGHDLNYQALAGVIGITAGGDGRPGIPGVQIGDLGAGALGAAVAILAALRHRDRTGCGQHCDVSMFDGLVSWLSLHATRYFSGGEVPGPGTMEFNGRRPCYDLYPCADGWMSVAALEPKFWSRLVRLLGLEHIEGDAYSEGEAGMAARHALTTVFMTRTKQAWRDHLEGHDVCCEPVLRFDEVFEQAHLRARGLLLEAGVGGPQPQVGFPFQLGETPLQVRRPAPALGAHNSEVLAQAGYTTEEIEAVLASGVMG